MEGCLRVISEKHEFLHKEQQAGASPSPNQLASFFQNLTESLKIHIRGCDAEVIENLKKHFADFGWNVVTNKSIRTSPPDLDELVRFIGFIKTFLENYQAGCGEKLETQQCNKTNDTNAGKQTFKLVESSPAISMTSDKISLGAGIYQARRGMYSVGSGDSDNAYLWAESSRMNNIWKKEDDVLDAYEWVMENTAERVPPQSGLESSRLFWLMRRLWEGCDAAHAVLDSYPSLGLPERSDPGRLRAMAPLAKKLLGYIHDDEEDF